MSSDPRPGGDGPILVLVGPTAVGKSDLAVTIARRLTAHRRPAEIVNTDSMLVYRGMDIGTAKPTVAERRGVPHHLLDIAEVTESTSVAHFQHLARDVVAQCRARGVIPILVGGSALYTRAVVDEFSFPGTDPVVRGRWEQFADERGAAAAHAELGRRDPDAASAIEPANVRRIVRALEIHELTGRVTARLPEPRYALSSVIQLGLDAPRDWVDRRIAARVERMWARGFIDEVRALERDGLRDGRTASRALGYRQVLDLLAGELTDEQARERTIIATRRFARRQLSWWRRDPRIRWLDATALAPDLVGATRAALPELAGWLGDESGELGESGESGAVED